MFLPSFFFSLSNDSDLLKIINELNKLKYNTTSSILIGPSNCGKTSLLFNYAYSAAMYGQTVWFICCEKKIHENFPLFQKNYEPESEILKRIKIKYIENHKTLRHFIGNLPLLEKDMFPNLLVIDGFSEYFPSKLPTQRDYMLETLACLKEIDEYAINTYGKHVFSYLCSLGMESQSESFQAIERWIDSILIIKEKSSPFEISFYSINKQIDTAKFKAIYSIESNILEVLNIEFECDTSMDTDKV